MQSIPIIAFSAWSGTGKTTVIEKLISELKHRGLRVAAVKHDAHDFEIDREGKDSQRFSRAGADITLINSETKTALIEQRSLSFHEALSLIHDVDIILAEGYNNEDLPRIGISRRDTGQGFRHPPKDCIAVVTDAAQDAMETGDAAADEQPKTPIPVFSFDETKLLADFILKFIQK